MKRREEEFAARLQKIQDKMNAMADTVVKNENEKRIREEKRLLLLQQEKDLRDAEEERLRKERIKRENLNINKYLMNQMDERQRKKLDEQNRDKEIQSNLLAKNEQKRQEDEQK